MALACLVPAAPSFAVTAGAVTADDRLLTFDTASPGTVTSGPRAITGLQPGETVLGIDMRPATNQLYALGSSGRLYRVNVATAAATQVGSGAAILSGTSFGFDFNPLVDRIRTVSDADQNFRLNPADGVMTSDASLAYAAGDPNAGDDPNVAGVAYTNNFAGAASTALYGIDTAGDRLVRLLSPNNGQLTTVSGLGFNAEGQIGFDIVSVPGTETAFAAMGTPSPSTSALYTLNLTTGAVTPVGNIGGGSPVKAFAIGVPPSIEAPPPEPTPDDPAPSPTPTETQDTTAPEVLAGLAATAKLKRVLRNGGVGGEVSCDEACDLTATLSGGGKSRAAKILGTGSSSLAEAGIANLDVDLNKAGRRYLGRRGRSDALKTRLAIELVVRDSAQNATNLTTKLTLKH